MRKQRATRDTKDIGAPKEIEYQQKKIRLQNDKMNQQIKAIRKEKKMLQKMLEEGH